MLLYRDMLVLPRNKEEWEDETEERPSARSLHSLHAVNSASKIGDEQFLALRTLWPEEKTPQTVHKYLSGMPLQGHLTRASKRLAGNSGWQHYLSAIGEELNDEGISEALGAFSLVLHHQNEIIAHIVAAPPEESVKVVFSPVRTRSQTVVAQQLNPIDDLIVRTAQISMFQRVTQTPQEEIEHSQGSLDTTKSSVRQEAQSIREEEGRRIISAPADEQIVNVALIDLLQALSVHRVSEYGWTLERKSFKLYCGPSNVNVFTAHVDGHLCNMNVRGSSFAIIEVKSHQRSLDQSIKRQESAEMACWIASEPDSHWQRKDTGNANF